jgi:hypothetical protein
LASKGLWCFLRDRLSADIQPVPPRCPRATRTVPLLGHIRGVSHALETREPRDGRNAGYRPSVWWRRSVEGATDQASCPGSAPAARLGSGACPPCMVSASGFPRPRRPGAQAVKNTPARNAPRRSTSGRTRSHRNRPRPPGHRAGPLSHVHGRAAAGRRGRDGEDPRDPLAPGNRTGPPAFRGWVTPRLALSHSVPETVSSWAKDLWHERRASPGTIGKAKAFPSRAESPSPGSHGEVRWV